MKGPYKRSSVLYSTFCAINGLRFALYSQKNMIIHIITSLAVIGIGYYFKISKLEWMILLLTISSVIIAETINTAVEISIDLVTKKLKFRAMLAKDIAAGAVLLSAVNAVIIGYLLFFDRLVNLITK